MGTTHQLQVNDTRVAFSQTGEGDDAAVLLHCSASSGSQWRALGHVLAEDFQVLTPDLYGYGQTDDWPGHGPLTLADEATAVIALIDRYDKPVHLVGHSYGGAVALKVAMDRSVRLQSLTLIEPVAFYLLQQHESDHELFGEVQSVREAVSGAVVTGDDHGGMRLFVDYWNGAGAWSRLAEEKRAALAKRTRKVALDFWSTTAEETSLNECRRLDVSTLILCGEKTPAPTRRITALLAQTIPTACYQTIPDAGHMAPLTHAEVVNSAIAEHLARNTLQGPLHHVSTPAVETGHNFEHYVN